MTRDTIPPPSDLVGRFYPGNCYRYPDFPYPGPPPTFEEALKTVVLDKKPVPSKWCRFVKRIKKNPGAFTILCMNLFWPTVLVIYAIFR